MQKNNISKGLKFKRRFTKEGVSSYDMFEYDRRTSVIKDLSGKKLYESNDVEVPKEWSQIATDILAQKYFRKAGLPKSKSRSGAENSVKQVVHRLVSCWKEWGEKGHYFASKKDSEIFYDELTYMLLGQYAAPNSPQWFNTGLHSSYGIKGKPQGHYYVDPKTKKVLRSQSAYERPQPHACFILSVEDDLVNENGIMDLWVREARIFKYGSGVGTNFSSVRGEGEKLSGGGFSSGLMSFLKIGDRAAGAIKSGGTTRRAAKMVCLDIDHPEVEDFINWKLEEEKKVAALIAAGYSSDYEGEAYRTVSGQNSNNSIRIPNSFFDALKKDKLWDLKARRNGNVMDSVPAKRLWDMIVNAAWGCADPGVQFSTTINEWHTCPKGGSINASNPCSEYMFLDNTACNLASLNLAKFFDEETLQFKVEDFKHACRLWTVVLEISVFMAQFPSKEVAQLSYEYRTLGLGYANLGSVLMQSGMAYDSDKARAFCGAVTSILHATSYLTSAEMAKELGAFERYEENKEDMLRVIRNHRHAAQNTTHLAKGVEILPQPINPTNCPKYLFQASYELWDNVLDMGEKYGFRNAQVTVIAPTGTIGLLMDCDTTGIEPEFALIKSKKLSGGGYFKIMNNTVTKALKNLAYSKIQIDEISAYVTGSNDFNDAPHINTQSLIDKGLLKNEIDHVASELRTSFHLSQAFNAWTLGEKCLKRFGLSEVSFADPNFNFLTFLSFTPEQIEEANEYICGTQTIEGAPHLKPEHLPIFDCANRCGKKGKRYIAASGHISMMAAAQPFLSGSISKTINLPNHSTVEDVAECYHLSWSLGLKANAIYRDGCKLSQPLSTSSNENTGKQELTKKQILDAARRFSVNGENSSFMRELSNVVSRRELPNKRRGFTQKAKIGGQTIFIRTGEYEDRTLGEIFVDMHKEGAFTRSMVNCFAIAISIGLQYGVPLKEFVDKFIFTKFEPFDPVVGHPHIKKSTSIVDFIFRVLAYEYLDRKDLVHILDDNEKGEKEGQSLNYDTSDDVLEDSKIEKTTIVSNTTTTSKEGASLKQQYADISNGVQSDAPPCSVCGHIMVRSGTCYKCLNCGTQGGCS